MKSLLDRLSAREIVLLIIIAVVSMLWVGTIGLRHCFLTFQSLRDNFGEISLQNKWLKKRTLMLAKTMQLSQSLDTKKMVNSAIFFDKISKLRSMLKSGNLQAQQPILSNLGVLQYAFVNAQLSDIQLLDFVAVLQNLQKDMPYIGVKKMQIGPSKKNPTMVSGTLQFYAINLNQSTPEPKPKAEK